MYTDPSSRVGRGVCCLVHEILQGHVQASARPA
jgi:hypothetical protein